MSERNGKSGARMDRTTVGWVNGCIGMVIFSGSLPATRAAVMGFEPFFLTAARAAVAGLLALALLVLLRQRRPDRRDLPPLAVVAGGVVIGFPLLSALALRHVSAAHSLVFIGLLPLVTAVCGAWRGGERPGPAFWAFSVLGGVLVAAYAAGQGEASLPGDLLMLAAVLVCGLGYAEGGRLSRRLGGWQVISWVLALSLPVTLPLAVWAMPRSFAAVDAAAWAGLAYVSLGSMLLGFVFWYRGLALGGIAAVGQLQLLQPFLGLVLAALLLDEAVSPAMLGAAIGVVACVAGARKFAA